MCCLLQGGWRVPGAGAALPAGHQGVPGQREGRLWRPRRGQRSSRRGVYAQPHQRRTESLQGVYIMYSLNLWTQRVRAQSHQRRTPRILWTWWGGAHRISFLHDCVNIKKKCSNYWWTKFWLDILSLGSLSLPSFLSSHFLVELKDWNFKIELYRPYRCDRERPDEPQSTTSHSSPSPESKLKGLSID